MLLLTICSIDSNTVFQKFERKMREREKKERKTSPRETWFLLNPTA